MFDNQHWKYPKSSIEREESATSKRYSVAFLLAGVFVLLAVTMRLSTSSVVADSSATEYTYLPITSSGYFEGSHLDGIAGRVFAQGKPAVETNLDLRHFDGTKWEVTESTKTDETGYYFFSDVDSLGNGEEYYVSFGQNESNPDNVYFWYGPIIDSYTNGDIVFGGSFDIADVPLKSPKSEAKETLPINFHWEKRSLPGDTYRLIIIDFDEDVFWRTFDLGDVDSFTLNNLAAGMEYGKQYAWYVEVYMGPDSFGESFMLNDITFLRPDTQQKSISKDVFLHGSGRGGR